MVSGKSGDYDAFSSASLISFLRSGFGARLFRSFTRRSKACFLCVDFFCPAAASSKRARMICASSRRQPCKFRFGGMAILGPRNRQMPRQCGHRTRPVPVSPMSEGFRCVTSRQVSRLTAVRHKKQTQVPLHIGYKFCSGSGKPGRRGLAKFDSDNPAVTTYPFAEQSCLYRTQQSWRLTRCEPSA